MFTAVKYKLMAGSLWCCMYAFHNVVMSYWTSQRRSFAPCKYLATISAGVRTSELDIRLQLMRFTNTVGEMCYYLI